MSTTEPDGSNQSRNAARAASAVSTWVTVVVAAPASITGLFVDDVYQPDGLAVSAGSRGGDLITATVPLPALVLASRPAARESIRARLIALGVLACISYTSAFYVFGPTFNDLFLLHVAAFTAASSAYAATQAFMADAGVPGVSAGTTAPYVSVAVFAALAVALLRGAE